MVKKLSESLSSQNRKLYGLSFFLFILSIYGLSGCSKRISDIAIIHQGGAIDIARQKDSLQIGFFGVASFLFEYKGRAVLTDPFISNPPARKVLFGKIRTDTALVDKYTPPSDLAKVNMVVVGHAHYDHLMDLPYMASHIPASAKFCGSRTMKHTLAAAKLPQQSISMNDIAADSLNIGQWIYSNDSMIRIMAGLSTHPPHFLKVILYEGPYTRDLEKMPLKTRHWKCGQTFSFMIDFLDNDKKDIAYRIFFQSSGAEPKQGFFPESVIHQKKPDVAVFGIANDHEQKVYPYEAVNFMQPDIIFVAHWENFMRAKEKPYKTVQTGNPEKFYQAIKTVYPNKSIILPAPGASFIINGSK